MRIKGTPDGNNPATNPDMDESGEDPSVSWARLGHADPYSGALQAGETQVKRPVPPPPPGTGTAAGARQDLAVAENETAADQEPAVEPTPTPRETNAAERAAKIVARPMRLLSVAASPFVWLLSRSTAGVARLLGLQRAESKVTEAEIRSIIQEGAEDGEVQAVEQQIMGRVFSLGDRTVESIMTHRSELAWIDAAASAAQIRETVARAPHNRYPVGEGSLDKLLGVVCLKDLFLHLGDEGFDLRRLVAPAKFFHEGFEVYNALEQLRTEQLGYGIICDEFGVTRGIITLRDIFEALVGELPDPREEPDIVRREDGSCLVDGQCPFYDFLDWFGLENALPCNAYNTVSGLILDQLAHIPATGEKLEWNGFTFEIVDMDGARIDKILVSQKQQP